MQIEEKRTKPTNWKHIHTQRGHSDMQIEEKRAKLTSCKCIRTYGGHTNMQIDEKRLKLVDLDAYTERSYRHANRPETGQTDDLETHTYALHTLPTKLQEMRMGIAAELTYIATHMHYTHRLTKLREILQNVTTLPIECLHSYTLTLSVPSSRLRLRLRLPQEARDL